MYLALKYINLFSVVVLLSLASPLQLIPNSPSAKTLGQTLPPSVPTLLQDEDTNNQDRLPWILVSKNRNQAVPIPATAKISAFLTSNGLTPVSCSASSVVIISINNLYVACSLPNSNFPAGNYNANIPDI